MLPSKHFRLTVRTLRSHKNYTPPKMTHHFKTDNQLHIMITLRHKETSKSKPSAGSHLKPQSCWATACDGHGHMSPAQSIPISGSKMTQFPFPTAPVTIAINLHSHCNSTATPSTGLLNKQLEQTKHSKPFIARNKHNHTNRHN